MSKREPGYYVIFDGPPGHEPGRFIEVEDETGRSVGPTDTGAEWAEERWIGQPSTWALGPFPRSRVLAALDVAGFALMPKVATADWTGSTREAKYDSRLALAIHEIVDDEVEIARLHKIEEAAQALLVACDACGPRSLSSGDDIAWAFARGGVLADLRAALAGGRP